MQCNQGPDDNERHLLGLREYGSRNTARLAGSLDCFEMTNRVPNVPPDIPPLRE